MNMKIIKLICKILNIKKKIYFSSDLKLTEKGVKKLITICKIYKCDNYLANNKTVENYGVKEFRDNNISVLKQNFFEDRYTQEYDRRNGFNSVKVEKQYFFNKILEKVQFMEETDQKYNKGVRYKVNKE